MFDDRRLYLITALRPDLEDFLAAAIAGGVDVVQVRERSRNMALVIEAMGSGERDVPEYVEVDQKAGTAKFVRMPSLSDIPFAAKMEPNLVVEFYSS